MSTQSRESKLKTPARFRARSADSPGAGQISASAGPAANISYPERVTFLARDKLGRFATGSLQATEKVMHEYNIPSIYLCNCNQLKRKCNVCNRGWEQQQLPGPRGEDGNLLPPQEFNRLVANAQATHRKFVTPAESRNNSPASVSSVLSRNVPKQVVPQVPLLATPTFASTIGSGPIVREGERAAETPFVMGPPLPGVTVTSTPAAVNDGDRELREQLEQLREQLRDGDVRNAQLSASIERFQLQGAQADRAHEESLRRERESAEARDKKYLELFEKFEKKIDDGDEERSKLENEAQRLYNEKQDLERKAKINEQVQEDMLLKTQLAIDDMRASHKAENEKLAKEISELKVSRGQARRASSPKHPRYRKYSDSPNVSDHEEKVEKPKKSGTPSSTKTHDFKTPKSGETRRTRSGEDAETQDKERQKEAAKSSEEAGGTEPQSGETAREEKKEEEEAAEEPQEPQTEKEGDADPSGAGWGTDSSGAERTWGSRPKGTDKDGWGSQSWGPPAKDDEEDRPYPGGKGKGKGHRYKGSGKGDLTDFAREVAGAIGCLAAEVSDIKHVYSRQNPHPTHPKDRFSNEACKIDNEAIKKYNVTNVRDVEPRFEYRFLRIHDKFIKEFKLFLRHGLSTQNVGETLWSELEKSIDEAHERYRDEEDKVQRTLVEPELQLTGQLEDVVRKVWDHISDKVPRKVVEKATGIGTLHQREEVRLIDALFVMRLWCTPTTTAERRECCIKFCDTPFNWDEMKTGKKELSGVILEWRERIRVLERCGVLNKEKSDYGPFLEVLTNGIRSMPDAGVGTMFALDITKFESSRKDADFVSIGEFDTYIGEVVKLYSGYSDQRRKAMYVPGIGGTGSTKISDHPRDRSRDRSRERQSGADRYRDSRNDSRDRYRREDRSRERSYDRGSRRESHSRERPRERSYDRNRQRYDRGRSRERSSERKDGPRRSWRQGYSADARGDYYQDDNWADQGNDQQWQDDWYDDTYAHEQGQDNGNGDWSWQPCHPEHDVWEHGQDDWWDQQSEHGDEEKLEDDEVIREWNHGFFVFKKVDAETYIDSDKYDVACRDPRDRPLIFIAQKTGLRRCNEKECPCQDYKGTCRNVGQDVICDVPNCSRPKGHNKHACFGVKENKNLKDEVIRALRKARGKQGKGKGQGGKRGKKGDGKGHQKGGGKDRQSKGQGKSKGQQKGSAKGKDPRGEKGKSSGKSEHFR